MRYRPAFTLLETLIVICIIGIVMLASVPLIAGFLSGLELRGAGRTIVEDIRLAQQRSISSNTDVEVDFRTKSLLGDPARYFIRQYDPARKDYVVVKTVRLQNKFNFAGDIVIKFARTGFPQVGGSGTVTLKDLGDRICRVVVSSAGRVRME